MTTFQLWGVALGLGFVVVLVVWLLLALILGSARRIRATVDEIWIVGPGIANNTAHIDVIRRINGVAGQILRAAGGVAFHAARIHEHANGCPGCPRCVTGWGSGPGPELEP
jgi:hypothetical protein